MNEMNEQYINALNRHAEALESNTRAMNNLSAILESVFATGLDRREYRSLSSIVSEVGEIITYANNRMSDVAGTLKESATQYASAAECMNGAANKNSSAAEEMNNAAQRNCAAAGDMLDAARRSY
jgi:hypothetical protein